MRAALKVIRGEAHTRVANVIAARDDFAVVARNLLEALSDSRVAVRALSAVDPENGVVESAVKYDGEVRELVAELSAMFVVDGGTWVLRPAQPNGDRDA